MTKISVFCSRCLLIAILSLSFFSGYGQGKDHLTQTPGESDFSIRWVGQYPESKEKKGNKKKGWFSNLLFGKKPDELVKPMSLLAVCPDSIWVADQGNESVLQIFNQKGESIALEHENFKSIPSIVGSCFMPENKILITDSRLNTIFQFSPGQKELSLLNDSLKLEQPTGIAFLAERQEIWVVETKEHRISVLNESGELIKQIGGRGNIPGKFNFPTYIWIDKEGLIYVVDAMNFRIQIFDNTGAYLSDFGKIGDSSGYFSRPKGVATDSFGHIYVADALFHVVQVFDKEGRYLNAFGSQGQGKEQFWMPTGIYIDNSNFIYIADSYNSRIQIFELTY